MPAKLAPDRNRGPIIAVGDIAIDDRGTQLVLRLLALTGPQPRVVVINATQAEDGDNEFENLLFGAGAGEVHWRAVRARGDCEQRALLDAIDHAHIAFLVADQPLRLSTLIGGTPLARAVRRRNADGMAVAGCGPGAALLCEHMLTHGADGPTPRIGGAAFGLSKLSSWSYRPACSWRSRASCRGASRRPARSNARPNGGASP